ncbi:MAG: zinc ribbon domain-containing protein [Oscillospiraceae bacterium]
MKKCSKCGFTADNEDMDFCVRCGNKLEEYTEPKSANSCPKCGKINPEDNAFCMYCGTKLNGGEDIVPEKSESEIIPPIQREQSKHSSRNAIKTAAIVLSIVVVASAAVVGAVYAVRNDIFSKPAPVQNIQTVDKQYNIKGSFCAEIDGVIYFTDEESKLCAAESEIGIRKISSAPILEFISNEQYIYYITENGLYSYNTSDGAIVADTTDELVSVAKMMPRNKEPQLLTIDKNGNVYTFTGDMSDISIKCKCSAKVEDTPKLFSGVNAYAYYNGRARIIKETSQKNLKELKIDGYLVSCDSDECYYLNEGLWTANNELLKEQQLIDSAEITELCCNDEYIAFDYNGICIMNTKDDQYWRLSDKSVSGLCIDGNTVYFTSEDDGQIYSVPVKGGNVVPLTYYVTETVSEG